MNAKHLSRLAYTALALLLSYGASAQDDHWAGTTNNTLWNNPANWSLGIVPPPGDPNTTYQGNVWLDAANGDTVFTIPAGDVEAPGVGNSSEVFNTIFGPEWGTTLNVYGSLTFDWLLFPVQNDPAPGRRSYINIFTNGVVSTSGAALGIGDSWFYTAAPYETVNLYANAQYNSLGGAGLWLGGHLNIYDNAQFLVNGYVNMDNSLADSDGTRSIVIGGGKLTLPENTINAGNSGSVYDWIARGILRAYGKGEDTNDLVITDDGVNTYVTPVPLGGALQRVYFQPLLRTNVTIGVFQQSTLVGDYPSVSGVLLSSSEPGLSPSSFPHPVYTSSNPNVFTVDTNGMVTATGYGTATLSATVGAFTSTNTVSLTVAPPPNPNTSLIHRYSFSESSGTTVADSVGGWNGTLNGDAAVSGTGQLMLSGNLGSSVTLPPGILSNLDEVTIETWVSFPSANATYATLFSFGLSDTTAFDANEGAGENYISFSPDGNGLVTQANFAQGVPGTNGERDAVSPGVLDGQSNLHIVTVYHPYAGTEALYINGTNVATMSMFNNMIDPVAYLGPTYSNRSILNFTLADDQDNYIGQALYTAYPGILANVDEFRIYNTALTPGQIAADHALGPNTLMGTSTAVSMNVSMSGGNLVIKWPTTSALVNLMSSPTLGAGAVWTPVNTSALTTDGSGNYQITIPASGTTQFYRLQ
ncbi:MAG TPA: LamG-like jellyroll fold domain-containing protein [Candidatus Angelobacter sp.]|nr:LamG-like jellyroll fold domain-containing protein [Candidatus Angelobacter sp.]